MVQILQVFFNICTNFQEFGRFQQLFRSSPGVHDEVEFLVKLCSIVLLHIILDCTTNFSNDFPDLLTQFKTMIFTDVH